MSNKKKVALSDDDLEQVVGGIGGFDTGVFDSCGIVDQNSSTDTNGFEGTVNSNTDTNGFGVADLNMMNKPAIS